MRKNIVEDSGSSLKAPQGHQISAVYEDAEGLMELFVTYFKDGLEGGEYCLWFSPDKLATERAKNELVKAGVDVERCLLIRFRKILLFLQ